MSAQPQASPDRYVLEINRAAVDRSFGWLVGLMTVLFLAVLGVETWIASLDPGAAGLISFLPALVFMASLVALYSYAWGATRAIEWPLQLTYTGLTFCTPRGRVELPWEAVTDVRVERPLLTRQLIVRLHPQAGPGAPGVITTLPNAAWRIIRRSGLRLSLRVVRAEPADVTAAIAHFSRGRWQPVPPG